MILLIYVFMLCPLITQASILLLSSTCHIHRHVNMYRYMSGTINPSSQSTSLFNSLRDTVPYLFDMHGPHVVWQSNMNFSLEVKCPQV